MLFLKNYTLNYTFSSKKFISFIQGTLTLCQLYILQSVLLKKYKNLHQASWNLKQKWIKIMNTRFFFASIWALKYILPVWSLQNSAVFQFNAFYRIDLKLSQVESGFFLLFIYGLNFFSYSEDLAKVHSIGNFGPGHSYSILF